MKHLARLYPKAWRDRYGAELAALLERRRISFWGRSRIWSAPWWMLICIRSFHDHLRFSRRRPKAICFSSRESDSGPLACGWRDQLHSSRVVAG